MTPYQEGIRAALLGVVVNLVLAIVKVVTGILGHSYALIADGIESAADIMSSLVMAGGLHVSARPADENHPYGHGKAEPLAGVAVAVLLLCAGLWIGWHSISSLSHPHRPPAAYTLLVLAIVVIVKEVLSRHVHGIGQRLGSTAVRGDAWHHRSDALTSAAAFIGISIALIGGPDYAAADDWAALTACGVILFNGVRLLRDSGNDLMDASVSSELIAKVRAIAASVTGVQAIDKCRVRKMGLDLTMDIHVIVNGDISVRAGHDIAHAVKDRLLQSGNQIIDVVVHIEPTDVLRRIPASPSRPNKT